MLVRLNAAVTASPETLALTAKLPLMLFAVSAGAVACPLELVTAVAVAEDPNKAAAPVEGAVNVTVTPLTGLPAESVTVPCRAVENAAPTIALWGVPADAEIFAAGPGVFVRLNTAVPPRPVTLAVTR